ncbi:uncharacterized protein LOC106773841 [Vigna radiata var. radiata]|uniref:Uncharacterized protein LOC106773841 n=1 Tax=Vigna radiata var. radiata TaxID=3916 RepID=A0A1S3VD78_VIGRR|nr:uncharacterized protein LOC106773841 [Vigna radiata var. radiata]
MATTFTFIQPPIIRASAGSPAKPDANNRKPVSSNWWAPLFGWPAEADYISPNPSKKSDLERELNRPGSRFSAGCFTEEKAKQLRKKTVETSTFHDIMYHSAIASRLASDISKGYEK